MKNLKTHREISIDEMMNDKQIINKLEKLSDKLDKIWY